MKPKVDCIYLTPWQQDFREAARLAEPGGVRLHHSGTLGEARHRLIVTGARVLLTEVTFLGGTWEDARDMLLGYLPAVSLVVAAAVVDERFWIVVLEKGGYDLVPRPFQADELRRILSNAHFHAIHRRPEHALPARKLASRTAAAYSRVAS